MSTVKKIWNTSWRVAVGVLLLLWIFHSIFVNEAREMTKRVSDLQRKAVEKTITPEEQNELSSKPIQLNFAQWEPLTRQEKWGLGWTHGPPALWETLRSVRPGALSREIARMSVPSW